MSCADDIADEIYGLHCEIARLELELERSTRMREASDFEMRLARNISTTRQKVGYTQRELAALVQVSGSCMSQYETGRRRVSVEMLAAIASALGTTISELVPEYHWKAPVTDRQMSIFEIGE